MYQKEEHTTIVGETVLKQPPKSAEYCDVKIGSWWKLQKSKYEKNKLLDYQKEMIDTLNIKI